MNSSSASSKPWEHAKAGSGSGSDPLAARFVESISYDRRMFEHDILGSIAHARMLADAGLISDSDLSAIEQGLEEIRWEIRADLDGWPGWKVDLEDVHMCIEAALIEKIGDAGRKLHTGRSRNDQVALDLHLWLMEACRVLNDELAALCRALLDLAQRDGRIVMPSYTHLQRAQPIVLGAELLCWEQAFSQCAQRLEALPVGLRISPLGAGAIAGSSLPIDRQASVGHLNKLLGAGQRGDAGFEAVSDSSIYSTASRDTALDALYGMSMAAMWLSRWAEQWIIYASTEFGFVKLDDRYTTGSSMMPQKRNPDMLELIRGRCGNVYGHLVAMLTICKGLTVGYNRDLQEDKRHLFAAFDMVRDSLVMARRIVESARFNEDRIRAGLERGFLDATSLADYLVLRGIPFRLGHQVVGRLVQLCEERGLTRLGDLELGDFNRIAASLTGAEGACDESVFEWLGPDGVVKRYRSQGNAGLDGFRDRLEARRSYWAERVRA